MLRLVGIVTTLAHILRNHTITSFHIVYSIRELNMKKRKYGCIICSLLKINYIAQLDVQNVFRWSTLNTRHLQNFKPLAVLNFRYIIKTIAKVSWSIKLGSHANNHSWHYIGPNVCCLLFFAVSFFFCVP